PIGASLVSTTRRDGYVLETLMLHLNGTEAVPAYFVKPAGVPGDVRLPAVLFSHSHGGRYELGKDELLAGNTYLTDPPYAQALTAQGYAVLCIDAWLFGARRGDSESLVFKRTLWRGEYLWGLMVYDALRALDYLCGRDDVDPGRIAALGMSMGSTMSWWLAALDERVKVCADLCCLTDFETIVDTPALDGHSFYYFVPGLLKHFSTADINELIVPRAHLALAGSHDPLTPAEGLARVDARLRDAYAAAAVPDRWRLAVYDTGHEETPAMRRDVLGFLAAHL
ncbi:MAG: acetylxylan esterase, partial [Actinomycetia bacterium]|nr:acetylxylan esterase [Actinomycetes bacterium]